MLIRADLVKPSIDLRDEYISFYEEWKENGEHMVPWVISKEPYDFQGMLQYLNEGEKATVDLVVPHSTYWLINEEKKVVGAVNIRHRLNEKLLNRGGHIGYGIRPSERRKGYAGLILSLALLKTRELGIQKVLVTCDKSNTASEKTIVKNGGVLASEFIEDNGNIVRRFWIGQ